MFVLKIHIRIQYISVTSHSHLQLSEGFPSHIPPNIMTYFCVYLFDPLYPISTTLRCMGTGHKETLGLITLYTLCLLLLIFLFLLGFGNKRLMYHPQDLQGMKPKIRTSTAYKWNIRSVFTAPCVALMASSGSLSLPLRCKVREMKVNISISQPLPQLLPQTTL